MLPFTPYKPSTNLSNLAESRLPTLERALRAIQTTQQHLVLRGRVGSGRRTLIGHVLSQARSIGRNRLWMVDPDELASRLYEIPDLTEDFRALRSFTKAYPRSLVYIPTLLPMIDGASRDDLRRLGRVFRELLVQDIQIVTHATDEEYLALTGQLETIRQSIQVLDLPLLTAAETSDILSRHGVKEQQVVTKLAERFFATASLPGSALKLWRSAVALSEQRTEPTAITHVYQVIAEQRGIPLEAISASQHDRLAALPQILKQRIIGQDHAVTTVSRVLTRAHAGFRAQHRPIASFLFLGPSGVGKTELAKALSTYLYRDPRAFVRVDMSEFSESHTVQRLIGAPPGYVGYEEGGQLTNPVDREPYSLVLLDEIEKAHPKVFDIFLQLLDDGRLTDGRGKTVDYSQTIVVATSNVGLTEIVQAATSGRLTPSDEFLTSTLLPLLAEHFRPEFLNRFDAIVVFQPLTVNALVKIARQEITDVTSQLAARNISLTVHDATLQSIAERGYQPTFGARPIKRLIQDTIVSPIAERIVRGEIKTGESVSV